MNSSSIFSVGNYLIDSNEVYIITNISDGRLYYRPAQDNGPHSTVTGSIPVDNAIAAGFRLPLTPAEIKRFLTELKAAKPAPIELLIESKSYRDLITPNDPFKVIPLLKQLWISQNQVIPSFSSNNRDTLENILAHLAVEFSLVTHSPVASIRKKFAAALS